MKRIAIIGSAHLGQQIAHHIHTDTEDKVVAFFDDFQPKGTIIDSIPVIGGTNDILEEYSKNSFDELLIDRDDIYPSAKDRITNFSEIKNYL